MDQDWACDEVLLFVRDLFDELNIPVTLFITNDTPVLQKLRDDPLFTLAIHPNFLPHLNGTSGTSYEKTIRDMLTIVPEAKTIRCHALVDATPILCTAFDLGLERDSNLFIPYSSGITLQPFTHFSGIRRIPYFYEDDAWCLEKNAADAQTHLLKSSGLRIFNFHPIHLYLNTETMDRYQLAKPYYHDFTRLKGFVNPDSGNGAQAFLRQIVRCARSNVYSFGRIEEL